MKAESSALYWLPRLEGSDLRRPNTLTIPCDWRNLIRSFLDPGPLSLNTMMLLRAIDEAATVIGYPVFIRTDLASAKHEGPRAYRAESKEDLVKVVGETVEDNEMKFGIGGPDARAFLVRQWLDLKAPFAAFKGHPIAREFRYFADQEKVICSHPYWPEEAIRFYGKCKEPKDWRDQLAAISAGPTGSDAEELRGMALAASKLMGEAAWSVDFAQDIEGKWWLIDMALAEESWHPEHRR